MNPNYWFLIALAIIIVIIFSMQIFAYFYKNDSKLVTGGERDLSDCGCATSIADNISEHIES